MQVNISRPGAYLSFVEPNTEVEPETLWQITIWKFQEKIYFASLINQVTRNYKYFELCFLINKVIPLLVLILPVQSGSVRATFKLPFDLLYFLLKVIENPTLLII